MSEYDERSEDVFEEIKDIEDEKKLLEIVYDYYIFDKDPKEIATYNIFNIKDFEAYLQDQHYPRVFSADKAEIKEKIDNRHLKLNEKLEKIRKREKNYQFELYQELENIKKKEEERQQKIKKKIQEIKKREEKRSEEIYKQKEAERKELLKKQEEIEQEKRATRLKIKKEQEELYQQQQKGVLGTLKQIMFIPSWRKLIEDNLQNADFKGFYLNKSVNEILQDSVVFLPDIGLTGFEETRGEPFFFMTGIGIYYTRFRLGKTDIIADHREITGLVLPMNIYEKARDISGTVLNSKQLLMTEYMVSIPFSMLLEKETTQMYKRGVIARNVVHPYKESWNKLLEVCKDRQTFKQEDGMKILSGGLSTQIPLYTNELLTENPLDEYSKLTAGIKNVQPKLDKILNDLQISGDFKKRLFQTIKMMKEDYVEKGYPKLLDWVP